MRLDMGDMREAVRAPEHTLIIIIGFLCYHNFFCRFYTQEAVR